MFHLKLSNAKMVLGQRLRERIGHCMAASPACCGMRTYLALPSQGLGIVPETGE